MIRVVRINELYCPVVICDWCKERITDYKMAAVVSDFNLTDAQCHHVHKGKCHDLAETMLGIGASPGWEEMGAHLIDLAANVGLEVEKH